MNSFGKDEIFRLLGGFLADQKDPDARRKIIQDALEKMGCAPDLISAAQEHFCSAAAPRPAPPRLNVDLGSVFEVGCAAHFEFHLICPGYRDKPKVSARLRLLDQDDWKEAPELSTEEPGYWIFAENFLLTKGGRPCPPGTYAIELAAEFRTAPEDSLGRFLRASLKIQVHAPNSGAERTLEIDGEGLSIINLQGHDLRGFSHVKLKGGDKSVVNLHQGASHADSSSANSPTTPSAGSLRYVELPLKQDFDRTDSGVRACGVASGASTGCRLMLKFPDGRRTLIYAQDSLRLGRNRDRGNDVVLRCLPRNPENDRTSLSISKSHCRIGLTREGVVVGDLGSSTGTTLDRQRLNGERPQPLSSQYDGQTHLLTLADNFELGVRLFSTPAAHQDPRLQVSPETYTEAVRCRIPETWSTAAASGIEAVRIERRSNLPAEEYVLLFRQAWLGSTDDCAIRLPPTLRRTRSLRLVYLGQQFWLERLDDQSELLIDGHEPATGDLWPLNPEGKLLVNGLEICVLDAAQDLGEGSVAGR